MYVHIFMSVGHSVSFLPQERACSEIVSRSSLVPATIASMKTMNAMKAGGRAMTKGTLIKQFAVQPEMELEEYKAN